MDWLHVLEIFSLIGGIATVFGLFLAPMFWLGSKIDSLKSDIERQMRDFHGRLCAIEERRKK